MTKSGFRLRCSTQQVLPEVLCSSVTEEGKSGPGLNSHSDATRSPLGPPPFRNSAVSQARRTSGMRG